MIPPLLSEIIIILALSAFVLFVFNKLNLPTLLGFLLTGIIAGPTALGLIEADSVNVLSQIGVVLLLFTIGLDFSVKEMMGLKKAVFIGGPLQVGLTVLAVFLITYSFGIEMGQAIFLGFMVSMSSTVILLKVMEEFGQVDSLQAKTGLAISIFQDLFSVPMMLFIPLLAGTSIALGTEFLLLAIKGVLIIVAVYLLAKFVMPKLLFQVAKSLSKELFLLTILVICFAIAWGTGLMGLSLALGAFLAGVIISESEYSHQAVGNIVPFKVIFESFFFVSVGMMLDLGFLIDNILVIILLAVAVIILKIIILVISTMSLKLPLRVVLLTSVPLSQVGEFAFILSVVGMSYNIMSDEMNQYFLALVIITMATIPFLFRLSQRFAVPLASSNLAQRWEKFISGSKNSLEDQKKVQYKNHLVVIGYGLNGRNVVKAARYALIPYVILDLNADTINKEKEKGEPIFYGDGVNMEVLEALSIRNAKAVVVGVSDPIATRRVVANINTLSPNTHVIVRTRYIKEIEELLKLGANTVISEEFETSIEMFAKVLSIYMIPENEVEKLVNVIRADGYEMLRSISPRGGFSEAFDANLSEVNLANLKVPPKCSLTGKTLKDLDMRNKFGTTLLAIKREREIINNPPAETELKESDILYLFGEPSNIINFKNFMEDN